MREISVELTVDNSDEVLKAFEEQVERGLEMIGLQAERHAKENITANGTIDTGLLRNSIAYAVSGTTPSTGAYGNTGKKARTYTADKPDRSGKINKSKYLGKVGSAAEKAVYIGTNVKYAPYVEYGHQQYGGGGHVPEKPFLRPAAAEHNDEYKLLMEKALKDEQ
jgi:hypothetical protein